MLESSFRFFLVTLFFLSLLFGCSDGSTSFAENSLSGTSEEAGGPGGGGTSPPGSGTSGDGDALGLGGGGASPPGSGTSGDGDALGLGGGGASPPGRGGTFPLGGGGFAPANEEGGSGTLPVGLPVENQAELTNYFYFSYDDSASTASVELAKYALSQNTIPHPGLARPWEYFNYEPFSSEGVQSMGGLFEASIGLLKRGGLESGIEYQLGVYIRSPFISKEERGNTVLTLLLDLSGSMSQPSNRRRAFSISLLELAKHGLRQLPDSLKPGDVVNLVVFSNDASLLLGDIPYSQLNASFIPTVNRLQVRGGTNLNAGIRKAYEVAQVSYDPNKLNRVIMLTDAYANVGQTDSSIISENTRINEQEGIYFSGLGMGSSFNEAFLNELTEAGRGAYFSLITKKDAEKAFQERFIAQLLVAAKSVRFRLDYPRGLRHTRTASEESSTNPADVQPTNFSYNTSQYFYEVFMSEAEINDSEVFTLTAYYKDPVTNQDKEEVLTKSIRDSLNTQTNNIRDAESIFLFNELLSSRMTPMMVQEIITRNDSNESSPLFNEYKSLIEKYISLLPSDTAEANTP